MTVISRFLQKIGLNCCGTMNLVLLLPKYAHNNQFRQKLNYFRVIKIQKKKMNDKF